MQPMPDMTALLKIAQSPAGQKLLAKLQSNQSVDMHSIAAAAAAGSLDGAKEKLSSVLDSKEARELLKQLENQL